MNKIMNMRRQERGGAGVKLTIILVIIFLVAFAGYNYVPVAYQGQNFKEELHTAVVQGVALPGAGVTPLDAVKAKVKRATVNNNIPADAFVEVKQANNVIQAHVAYTKEVHLLPFGLYNYNYEFDHVATPTGFLFKE